MPVSYTQLYDVKDGKQLWQARLPAGGQATPMSYTGKDGRQYVLIVAGGHGSFGTRMGDLSLIHISSMIFITFTGALFPILLNTVHGVEALDPRLLASARSLGAGRRALLREVLLPGAGPGIFTGLAIGMGTSWFLSLIHICRSSWRSMTSATVPPPAAPMP